MRSTYGKEKCGGSLKQFAKRSSKRSSYIASRRHPAGDYQSIPADCLRRDTVSIILICGVGLHLAQSGLFIDGAIPDKAVTSPARHQIVAVARNGIPKDMLAWNKSPGKA